MATLTSSYQSPQDSEDETDETASFLSSKTRSLSLRPDIYSVVEKATMFPQAIAHRGFQARYPENTMKSFMGAVVAGAQAIETDLHVTRDKQVVLSHDPTLKRCFGVDKKISDCDYSYIKTLRTIKSPPQRMPTLKTLLEFLRDPAMKHVWLLLDIKVDNDADEVMKLTGEVIREVGGSIQFWGRRILLGVWAMHYVPLCHQYIPGCPVTHIGYSIPYARKFLDIPDISFNMYHAVLSSKCGQNFIKDARSAGRDVFAWTVNEESTMKWSICMELDGICVDDPVKFFKVCDEYSPGECDCEPWSWKRDMNLRRMRFFAWIFHILFRCKYCGLLSPGSYQQRLLRGITGAGSARPREAIRPASEVEQV